MSPHALLPGPDGRRPRSRGRRSTRSTTREHVPTLRAVPGVRRGHAATASPRRPSRATSRPTSWTSPAVLQSAAWKAAGEAGPLARRDPPAHDEPPPRDVRVGRAAAPRSPTRRPYVFWVMMDIEPPPRGAVQRALRHRAPAAAAEAARGRVNAVRYRTDGRRASPATCAAYEVERHRPADVEAVERHLRHRPLEARGAALHLQQEVTSSASGSDANRHRIDRSRDAAGRVSRARSRSRGARVIAPRGWARPRASRRSRSPR